jgi:peptidoglycan/xylan/chitin deacetylase (PgdA/CDA1 family)
MRVYRSISGLSSWLYAPKNGFRILLYHSVGTVLPHDTYGLSIDPGLFKSQIELLSDYNVSVTDIYSEADSSMLRIAITFDDGYKDTLYNAAPVLLKYNLPFTVFITKEFVKNGNSIYLDEREVKELSCLPGVTIGSHGSTHAPLRSLDDKSLLNELCGSKNYLEDLTGKKVDAISYPHGSVNQRIKSLAAQNGFKIGCCSRLNINDDSRDPMLLCRTEIIASDLPTHFKQKIEGSWDWYRFRHIDPVKL